MENSEDTLQRAGDGSCRTLGDLLYLDQTQSPVPESDWIALVQLTAGGSQRGLHDLYTRTNRVVYTLIERITRDPQLAEDATLDVFYGLWRRAPEYDPAKGSVVGWIAGQARSRAIERLRFARKRIDLHADATAHSRDFLGHGDRYARTSAGASRSLWGRLARRIALETGSRPVIAASSGWKEPHWREVAPGISCKLLASDQERQRVSMLVRLSADVEYPPHRHAGVEELHLLEGELWIDDRKLYPGDYNRAEPGSADKRVWTETGCTCILITSTEDRLS